MTGPCTRPVVAVRPIRAFTDHERLFDMLGSFIGVRFTPSHPATEPPAGMIVVGENHKPLVEATADAGIPVAVLSGSTEETSDDVVIQDHDGLPQSIRDVVFAGQSFIAPVVPDFASEVLATGPAGPVWSQRCDGLVHRIGAPPPAVRSNEVLRALLGPDDRSRTFAVIALFEFLRRLRPESWPQMPLRATFQFDDPNLRRRRYGHIDYRRLVDHADAHDYHASFAMIPLDAGRPSDETVRLFRERTDRISLVIHGNDHRRQELLRADRRETALALAAQALRRIEAFEMAAELQVGRVMVPPHGMCSREAAAALAILGYDCLCSLHAIPWLEQPPTSLPHAGLTPASFVDGCAVLPRVPLNDLHSELAIRAYLGQPLVLYGHHDDLAGGYEVLAEVSDRVNRLGAVRWCSLSEIARTNYQLRMRGDRAEVRAWSGRLDIRLPQRASLVTVAEPTNAQSSWFGVRGWTEAADGAPVRRFGEQILAGRSGRLHARLVPDESAAVAFRELTHVDPVAWVRRRTAELRDRAAPLSARAARHTLVRQ